MFWEEEKTLHYKVCKETSEKYGLQKSPEAKLCESICNGVILVRSIQPLSSAMYTI